MSSTATQTSRPALRAGHFTALLSMIMALAALGIDLMLPAFDDMRAHFGLDPDSAQVAQVVTMFLLGMALAQYFYGPLADRFGRKPVLIGGLAIYALAALGAALAPNLELVLLCRFIWGVGAAGPRVVSVSIVRDIYSGEEMARAMSFIMAVFVMVPVLAPSIGAGLLAIFPWQAVFLFAAAVAVAVAIWSRVLPETLDPANQRPIDRRAIAAATREVLSNRQTMGYTLARAMTFGVFSSYLASSERIFGEIYGRPTLFPFIFGGIAVTMGMSMLLNAKLVARIGARKMVHVVLLVYISAALVFWALSAAIEGNPPFWAFTIGLGFQVGIHALLIPNFNTIAMWPMGRIAGTASAVIGTISVAGGAFIGSLIDRQYTDTVTPLIVAFAVLGLLALLFVFWAERGQLFGPPEPAE